MKLPIEFYKKIVDVLPILCVDAVIVDKSKFLLIKRKQKPRKGKWWVPGGRVLKGETAEVALKRKVREEIGINVKVLMPLGYYEEHFKENEFGLKSGIHTLSIVFLATPLSLDIKLNNESSAWRFSKNLPKSFKIKPFNFYLAP
jgi:colanic acid biosynthesis protein WcaH